MRSAEGAARGHLDLHERALAAGAKLGGKRPASGSKAGPASKAGYFYWQETSSANLLIDGKAASALEFEGCRMRL